MNDSEDKETTPNAEQLNNLSVNANPARDFWEFLIDLLKTGIIVFVVAFGLRYFAIQPYIVDGQSMMPNYENREYLLAEKLSYTFGEPKRGDVVIFRYPKNPSVNYIKRIIGLPGETVKIADNAITIYNSDHQGGERLDETGYLPSDTQTYVYQNNGVYEQTLKENEYFVLGDNREDSSDSREWGILPRANIIGRAWLTLLPIDLAGFHKRLAYPNLTSLDLNSLALADPNR